MKALTVSGVVVKRIDINRVTWYSVNEMLLETVLRKSYLEETNGEA